MTDDEPSPFNFYGWSKLEGKRRVAAAEREEKVVFGGRLGTYRYSDMDGAIESALKLCEEELGRKA